MSIKILSAQQVKRVDAATIHNEPVSSIDLMERASQECADAFLPYLSLIHPVYIFCGSGNNGGDGFAVSRILRDLGFPVQVYYLESGMVSPDCSHNKARAGEVTTIHQLSDLPVLSPADIVIDALLGIGTSREPEHFLAAAINSINESGATVLSIDLPSGLPADDLPEWDTIINAHFTATFQQPKLTFFLRETADFVGEWQLLNIGLNEAVIQSEPSRYFYLDQGSVENSVHSRSRFSHKGTYGHALLIAGSKGKMGAAVLSAKAALRSGTGLLSVHVPAIGLNILQVSVPEAMCFTDKEPDHISALEESIASFTAIGIGPGIGTTDSAKNVLKQVLASGKPLVIDADGLNLLSMHPELIELLPAGTILTPHPKEFERLAGPSENSADRLDRLIHFAQTYHCIVVLKDAITAVATPSGSVFFNTTGNPGMATGGSGDVLTGIILGLLAQGYNQEEAAKIAVYFHGKAGDNVARVKGQKALIAGDLIDFLRIKPSEKSNNAN